MRRQLALNHWDVGYERFDGLRFKEARKSFLSSVRHDWTNMRSLAYLAATFLPVSLVRAARTKKRANS